MVSDSNHNKAPVSFFDYRSEFAAYEREFRAAFDRVMASGQLVLGAECAAFEREFAAWLGVPHAVGVNSGTDALILALRVLGIGAGDEVITVSNTAVPTISAIRAVGATPVCVDVDPDTLLMNLSLLEGVVTEKSRAIIPVHLFGNAVPMRPLLDFARSRNLRVIEDCAQSTGTIHDGRHCGTWGDIGCFSFYPTKNLGAYGDGGACVTSDPELAKAIRMQRMYGFGLDPSNSRYSFVEGLNSRLDELQAAFLRVKLAHLPAELAARRKIAMRLSADIRRLPAHASGDLLLISTTPGTDLAPHLFVVQIRDRQRLISEFQSKSIGFGIHYPVPVHLMDGYRSSMRVPPGGLPATEAAASRIVSLPFFSRLSEDAVSRVVEALSALSKD